MLGCGCNRAGDDKRGAPGGDDTTRSGPPATAHGGADASAARPVADAGATADWHARARAAATMSSLVLGRIDDSIGRLRPEDRKVVDGVLTHMAGVTGDLAGIRAAADLASRGAGGFDTAWWTANGTYPGIAVLHDASLAVLTGLFAEVAAKASGDADRRALVQAVKSIPLVQEYNSGGPVPDDRDRSQLLHEVDPSAPVLP